MGKTLGYGEITVANMTEPFTVMLTNEAQQFATDSNRKVTSAQSYYTDIIVIRGSQERTDYTIGNITSGSGITVSKSSKRVTFSVSADTTIGADTGVIEIPITLDGQTVKKQFSWSCGKQGPQGVKGNDGNSFAWNMLSETNCGKKHWGTESSGGKYSVEDFITEDNINAVKLICTEGISTSNWSYVLFKDIKMLKQLKPSTKYTLSYDIKANRSGAISHSICKGDVSNFCTNTVVVNNIIGNETWQHISVVLTTNDLKTTPTNEILYLGRNALSKVGYSIIKNLKLVEGDIDTPWSPSQSDIEGKGVVETVQYYLATSQASGVTSSTSGWSTDITTQKLTADKKYLWNCYQTKYSDGTSEPISTPKVIGVYGDKGTSTKIIRTGYKYTQNNIDTFSASGYSGTWDTADATTGLKVGDNVLLRVKNTTKGSDCLIFASITAIPSNYSLTCTSYGLIDNGADGQDGKNAKNLSITPSSQYFKSTDGGKTFAPNTITIKPTIQGEISFGKWQYSIDGGVSFTDVMSEQKGLTISNNVLTVSKDSSLYSDAVTMITFRAVASDSSFYDTCSIAKIYDVSDIGDGRNLWITRDNITLQACEKDKYIYTTTGTSTVCIGADATSVGTNTIALQTGTKYTISFVISSPSEVGNARWYFCTALNSTGVKNYGGYSVKLVTGENIVSQTITVDTSCDAAGLVIYNLPTDCIIKDIQVEKGSSPTGWTPAPEDFQMAILSTKSEISDVSLKVDNNKQAIEQRVEKTTYQQDLKLVKGDISKANEGLNKWRYEIYPKSLFTSEYQGKSTIDVFAKNTNLTPSQSVLINDTDLSVAWNYAENYIGYALTFAKFSAAKSVAITFAHDDGAHIYLNGKLIGGSDAYSQTGESLTLGFVKGWNCIEVVVNEGANTEGFKLGTTLSALSECQLMNCYYGTPVARQSHITNQLVQNTTDIDGISGSVQQVMSTVGGSGKVDEFVNNYSTWKKKVDDIETRVGKTYVTKNDFNGLEIGGVNLFVKSTASRGWWISNTGVLNADGGWGYSDYIDVSGMKNYIASGFTNLGISPATCFYDSNKTFISGVASKNQNSQDSKRKTLPIPSNAKYMRFSFALADIDTLKIEQGTKATAYSPAPEDNEINGQNLVSNLPSNWEQGSFDGSRVDVGGTYSTGKVDNSTIIRVKELVPVSGSITISNAYSNQSKKPIQHYIVAFDVDKKYLGSSYVSTAWNDFPRIVDMKDAKYIAVIVRYKDESAITPSDISQICLKIERGTSATPFTLALEDVNGKIVNVETIANQTAKKFEWIVKGGDSSSNFTLTDRVADLVADRINFNGLVKFSGLNTDLQNTINNKTNVSYLSLISGGNNQACWKIATIKISGKYTNQDIIIGVNHRGHGYTECRIQFKNADNPDPGLASFRQTGRPSKCWRIIKTANSTWELYLYKTDSWDDGYVVKYINPYHTTGNVSVTWSGENADLPSGTTTTEQMIADQTTIDGGIITTGYISADRIAAGSMTADKIATDAIKSRNYISSGGTQGSFLNLSDGSFTSPNLSWDSNGNLIATGGLIAGWTITNGKLYNGTSAGYAGIGKESVAWAFWAGASSPDDSANAPFRVGHDGSFKATNADITGIITATSGKIGRYDITKTYLMTNSGSNASGIGGNQAFWAGAEDSNSAPFRVGYDGRLIAENAVIRGNIEAGNLGDEGDTVAIMNGHIGIQGTSNNVEIYSTGFKFGIDGDYYLMSVSEGVKCYRNLYATDFIADGWIYNASGGHYTWKDRNDAYISCGDYNGHNVYYYANYHAFYVNNDSGSGMMYINTNGVTSRVGFTKTSDERIKKNFESFDDNIIDAYMNIEPVKYQLKQSSNDNYHFGFKAQHVDKVFSDYGDTYNESFDICTSRPIDPDKAKELYGVDDMTEEYGLRYDELIAPTTYMVQHIYKELESTKGELAKVKQEKTDLEVRLQAIEAKLGL